jgi:hypothetical protein
MKFVTEICLLVEERVPQFSECIRQRKELIVCRSLNSRTSLDRTRRVVLEEVSGRIGC